MDQHLADVENDMADLGHAFFTAFDLVAPGMAASMAFFMTVGNASPAMPAGPDQK